MYENGIRSVNVQRSHDGTIESVKIGFGPHYFVDLQVTKDGKLQFVLGATHHGFLADASEVGGQLESVIEEVRSKHPEMAVD